MLSVMYQSLTHYNYIVLVSLNDSREQNAILAVWSHEHWIGISEISRISSIWLRTQILWTWILQPSV